MLVQQCLTGGGGGGGGGGSIFAIIVVHRGEQLDNGIASQLLSALVIYVTACNSIIPIFIVTLYCSSIQSSRGSCMCMALFVLTGQWTKCNYN